MRTFHKSDQATAGVMKCIDSMFCSSQVDLMLLRNIRHSHLCTVIETSEKQAFIRGAWEREHIVCCSRVDGFSSVLMGMQQEILTKPRGVQVRL